MSKLTSVDNGMWYDPEYTGSGFEIRVLENGSHMGEFFCGKVPGWFPFAPVWFSIQGHPRDDGTLPLWYMTAAEFGSKMPLTGKKVGTVEFDRLDDTHIKAIVTINANGLENNFSPAPVIKTVVYNLVMLVR